MTMKVDHSSRLNVKPSTYKSAGKHFGWLLYPNYSSLVSDIYSALFDNARLIWDSGRGRWHTEPSSSVLRPETRAWARLCPASGLRLWLVRPVVAPAVLHPRLVLTLTLSLCQPRPSLSPLSLTLTQSSRASDDARTDVTAPRPAPPGTCYRPSRIILFPVWSS